MRIEIENGKLAPAINFMYGLKLARKHSRFRRHFMKLMEEKLQQYEEDRKELLEEHSFKKDGKAVIKPDGNYAVKDMKALAKDINELNEEKFIIEGAEHHEMIRTVKEILKKFEDEEYEGIDSEVYDYLCDQFQVDVELAPENTEPK